MPRQNSTTARRKALQESQLSQLDSLGSDKSLFETSVSAIEMAAGDFINRVHENLESGNMIVSGKIADIQLVETSKGIDIMANSWLLYQDKGVNGSNVKKYNTPYAYKDKKPPLQPFLDWVNTKNIQLRNNEKYKGEGSPFKDLTEEQQKTNAAYAIREKVFKEGMKPRNVYSKEIPQLIEDIQKTIADFSAANIVERIALTSKKKK
jgi:hypothetical protein